MPFAIRDFLQLTSGMIAHMQAVQQQITDFNVGSVNRTMLEAPAIQIDELYQMMASGLIEAIPTAVYRSFDFNLQAAVAASGFVQFSLTRAASTPTTIPTGTLIGVGSGVQYQTAAACVIPAGQLTGTVLAVSTTPGLAGNTLDGTITSIISVGTGANGVTNLAAFNNGLGIETEAARKLRFSAYVRSLARGTVASCQYGASLAQVLDQNGNVLESVARTSVDESQGYVILYIYNGVGSTSAALVAAAQAEMDGYISPTTGQPVPGYRPTGMQVAVTAMTDTPVNVALTVQAPVALQGAALQATLQQALASTIAATPSGGALLPLSLVNAALAVAGVVGASIASPTLEVACPLSADLTAGSIAITWAPPA